jgi:branched-chain amino acid transport system permease protein
VRGANLAIVTLGFAVAVDHVVFANTSVTGGYNGAQVKVPHGIDVNNTSQFHFLGLKIGDGLQPNPMSAMFVLVVVVLLCYAVANMRRSTTGRQMLATRSNERAAAAAGVNVSGTKLLAFAVSAFVAGIGGGVIAYHDGSVTADPTGQTGKWGYVASLIFFAFAYLGGISSVSGAIAGGLIVQGGLVFTLLEDKFGVPPGMVLVIGGFSLVLTAILNPEGIAGGLARSGGRLLERIRTRPEPPPRAPAGAAATEGAA